MPGLGYQGAYGAAGMHDALQDLIKQRLVEQARQEDQRRQALSEDMDRQRMALSTRAQDRLERGDMAAETRYTTEREELKAANYAKRLEDQAIEDRNAAAKATQDQQADIFEGTLSPGQRAPFRAKRLFDVTLPPEPKSLADRAAEAGAIAEAQAAAAAKYREPREPPKRSEVAQFNQTMRLQKDYDAVRKPVREMQRQLSIMKGGLEQAKKGNLNAGGQQILVTFQKILDPQSVVRESEYARSPEGLSVLDRVSGFAERVQKGGPGVPLSELQNLVSAGESMLKDMQGFTAPKRRQLEKTAQYYDIDPSLIFDDDDTETPGGAEPPGYQDYLKKRGAR